MDELTPEDAEIFKQRIVEKSALLNKLINSDDNVGEISTHIEWIHVSMDNIVISLLTTILLDSEIPFNTKVSMFKERKAVILKGMEERLSFGMKKLWEHAKK
jgi:hypothetical protein